METPKTIRLWLGLGFILKLHLETIRLRRGRSLDMKIPKTIRLWLGLSFGYGNSKDFRMSLCNKNDKDCQMMTEAKWFDWEWTELLKKFLRLSDRNIDNRDFLIVTESEFG